VNACLALHYLPGSATRIYSLAGWELGTPLLLRKMSDLLGRRRVIAALEALEGRFCTKYKIIAASFGVCYLKCCQQCGAWLYLRSACLVCGFPCAHNDLQDLTDRSILEIRNDNALSDRVNLELLEQARKQVIVSSIAYLEKCTHEKAVFNYFGGDIIFLFRNLVQYAGRNFTTYDGTKLHFKLAACLHSLINRWIAQHTNTSAEIEMEEILNTIEALHVFAQLGINEGNTIPTPNEISHKLTSLSIVDGLTENEGKVEKAASPAQATGREDSRKQRDHDETFQVNRIKLQLAHAMLSFDVTDILGYDPQTPGIPMTDPKHCSHCGTENSKGRTNCVDCNVFLYPKRDYGSLTDAIVWTYLFEQIDLDLVCNKARACFVDALKNLPYIRRYQRIDELGHDFFKLQCYYVTHLIYVLSDWGRHALQRSLFQEELSFFISNLDQASCKCIGTQRLQCR
jgi:hypothetical protein